MTLRLSCILLCGGFNCVAAESANIELIAFNCFICHAEQSLSTDAVPSLQGLPGKYVLQTLQDYQTDLRPGTIMPRIAKAYSSEEIQALANYFAQLKKQKE